MPSLGCGDPITPARLRPGQTVLDIGSGPGADCFEAARLVGQEGHVIGVDMTPEMVHRARSSARALDVKNVEFRLGEMEWLPVADGCVDVILSNCAVNLSPDLGAVFRGAFRVLRPGGVLAISDVMLDRPMPDALRRALPSAAASLPLNDLAAYTRALEEAGFEDIEIERTPLSPPTEAAAPLEGGGAASPSAPAARMVVQIGETGETLAALELAEDQNPHDLPRSIRGDIRARKP